MKLFETRFDSKSLKEVIEIHFIQDGKVIFRKSLETNGSELCDREGRKCEFVMDPSGFEASLIVALFSNLGCYGFAEVEEGHFVRLDYVSEYQHRVEKAKLKIRELIEP
ncbi:MAG: hypothetical protein WC663_00475 [Patescibacteria group bacterium]|jgi:hypothetical protein